MFIWNLLILQEPPARRSCPETCCRRLAGSVTFSAGKMPAALWGFTESLLSFFRVHWDHEPTPNPSQEGNRPDADKWLLPSWQGSGVGCCMKTLRFAEDIALRSRESWRFAWLILLAVVLVRSATVAEEPAPGRHPDERDGAATLIHRAEVIR